MQIRGVNSVAWLRRMRAIASHWYRGLNVGNEEAVASLRNGLDILGILGVISERLPQLAYGHTEAAVEINKRIFVAKCGCEVPPG
jgi:hypothetical protein